MDNSQLIERMRKRAKELRRMIDLTHDPRIAEILQQVIGEIDADVERLTREGGETSRH
jgi:hypothetical protein